MLFSYFKRKLLADLKDQTMIERDQLVKKIESLENEIGILVKHLAKEQVKDVWQNESRSIIIENVTIENLNIDQADLSSNFGQLGINELSGQLNIGTTYQSKLSDKIPEKTNRLSGHSGEIGPKTTIRKRRDE
ncbi:hypothetical protein SLL00_15950 [Metabacillus indicus]|uniref:hypothetical protein n=1 Tax=Metabacillus indicus TaxID=246786 RepID=UPI002A069A20|nr:hypothetical protein [Metabacillus indicus]MDX8291304.1 hypothetical protein [Metabacillus indicus]